MTELYKNLKRKASRWQVRPDDVEELDPPSIEHDHFRQSVILFLRDLDSANINMSWNYFCQGVFQMAHAQGQDSIAWAVMQACQNTIEAVNVYDYVLDHDANAISDASDAPDLSDRSDARPVKRRRLNLFGNSAGVQQVTEYDELISLARTTYPEEENLKDWLGRLYHINMRRDIASGERLMPVDSIFDFARAWSEVRYRYLNHSLRDDPFHEVTQKGNETAQRRAAHKGNRSNELVHESNVAADSKLVEFRCVFGTGFSANDRELYLAHYKLTPEEGRWLASCGGKNTGLRPGLPPVFEFAAELINAFFTWRVRVLECARKETLSRYDYRTARSSAQRDSIKSQGNISVSQAIQSAEDAYGKEFISALKACLTDASAENALHQANFNKLQDGVACIRAAIQACALNTLAELKYNATFQHSVANFPIIKRRLIRPTGSSLIATKRPPPTDRENYPSLPPSTSTQKQHCPPLLATANPFIPTNRPPPTDTNMGQYPPLPSLPPTSMPHIATMHPPPGLPPASTNKQYPSSFAPTGSSFTPTTRPTTTTNRKGRYTSLEPPAPTNMEDFPSLPSTSAGNSSNNTKRPPPNLPPALTNTKSFPSLPSTGSPHNKTKRPPPPGLPPAPTNKGGAFPPLAPTAGTGSSSRTTNRPPPTNKEHFPSLPSSSAGNSFNNTKRPPPGLPPAPTNTKAFPPLGPTATGTGTGTGAGSSSSTNTKKPTLTHKVSRPPWGAPTTTATATATATGKSPIRPSQTTTKGKEKEQQQQQQKPPLPPAATTTTATNTGSGSRITLKRSTPKPTNPPALTDEEHFPSLGSPGPSTKPKPKPKK